MTTRSRSGFSVKKELILGDGDLNLLSVMCLKRVFFSCGHIFPDGTAYLDSLLGFVNEDWDKLLGVVLASILGEGPQLLCEHPTLEAVLLVLLVWEVEGLLLSVYAAVIFITWNFASRELLGPHSLAFSRKLVKILHAGISALVTHRVFGLLVGQLLQIGMGVVEISESVIPCCMLACWTEGTVVLVLRQLMTLLIQE